MPTTILYVDDETDFFELIKRCYRNQIRAGERLCEFARSGEEALAMVEARSAPYELIVADISMPKMSGLQLLEALAEREVDTPVIIVSAYDEIRNIRAAMNRGAFDFLTKPVDLNDLEVTQVKALRQFDTLRRARAVERAYERPELAALGLVVAGVVHDLRSPLSSVSSFTALARELGEELREQLQGEQREDLSTIEDTLARIAAHSELCLDLVATLLDSVAGSGRTQLNKHVGQFLDLFLASMRASSSRLVLDIDRRFDAAIEDIALAPTQLTSVVINLLENAFHALRDQAEHEEGFAPRLEIETRVIDAQQVELVIADNGPGIPPELCARVCEPFFSTKMSGEGTGLGLYLVAKIANECGGKLDIETNQPRGAKIRVSLPR